MLRIYLHGFLRLDEDDLSFEPLLEPVVQPIGSLNSLGVDLDCDIVTDEPATGFQSLVPS